MACDQDISDAAVSTDHRDYSDGPQRKKLNVKLFAKWMGTATVHGVTVWLLPMAIVCDRSAAKQQNRDFWVASFTAFTLLQITVHMKLILVSKFKVGKLGGFAILAEFIAYLGAAFVLGFLASKNDFKCPADDVLCVEKGITLSPVCPSDTIINVTRGCYDGMNIPVLAFGNSSSLILMATVPLGLMLLDYVMWKTVWPAMH